MRLFVSLAVLAWALAACAPAPVDSAAIPESAEPSDSTIVTTTADVTTSTTEAIEDFGPHADLVEIEGWLQSEVSSLEELRGKVVVVQFWTFGCYNCKNTLPNLRELYARHEGDEFEVVGIHSPEFDYEKDPEAILAAAADLGVTWPIALDTNKQTFRAWQGSPAYWPRTYVLDQEGRIRFDRIGEGAYDELNETVAKLLG